jgi:hypothetical protein
VSKSQKKEALSKRQQAETTLKINVARLITDVASTQVKEHDDDRSSADSMDAPVDRERRLLLLTLRPRLMFYRRQRVFV